MVMGFRKALITQLYIQDFKRLIEFRDSIAEVNENNNLFKLKLKSTGEIYCDVYNGNRVVESGIYRASRENYRHVVHVPVEIPGAVDAMMDSAIYYPIYKREDNWIWPVAGENITYYNGEVVDRDDKLIYVKALRQKVLLKQGSAELQVGNNKYIMRANAEGDVIQYWKISGYSDWKMGYFSLSGLNHSEKQKAVKSDMGSIKIKDSIFKTPIYTTFDE
jgi:hypothetical protein